MNEEGRILDLLYRFENAGLVEQRIGKLISCLAKQVLGSFEKCQLQNDLCAYVCENTPYQHFLIDSTPQYVFDEDIEMFLRRLSMERYCASALSHPHLSEGWAVMNLQCL